jgi:hypothetical protein
MKKIVILILIFSVILSANMNSFAYSNSIPKGYLITINKSNNKLTLLKNGSVVRYYSVATGAKSNLTPEGKFKIVNKVKNPSWGGGGYASPIAGGASNNPLGKFWMGLSIGGGSTYGIHGTNNESSIGKYVSHGCIRMHNSEVSNLFYTVPNGTPVWIGTKNLLKSYGLSDSLIGYKSNKKVFQKNIVQINGDKMRQNGYVINGHTYIHWEVLLNLKISHSYLGNGKFKIGSRYVQGYVINGQTYLNWNTILPNKLKPIKIYGGFNFMVK